ncbi:MAG: ATP-binding protein [Flavobacteriales bacterium]|jgi:predicted AAA+ superfamily ATPase
MSVLRRIYTSIEECRSRYPIIALTGPRQSGKTTFLKNQYPDYTYVSLENPDVRNFALEDPNGFLKQYDRWVILDEVQRAPELFSYLQTKVDEDQLMGQYILSGSQNFQLIQRITQSLAGRVALFKLLPFDISELQLGSYLSEDYADVVVKGSYPGLYDRDIPSKVFYSNYIQTYIERDLTELVNIKDLSLFRKFIALCAGRVGQLLNLNSLALECGISQPTAKSWLSVLETSYVVHLIQPFHQNFNKRITKSPKLYFYDTGLVSFLLKIENAASLKTSSYKGNLFENFIINELVKSNFHGNRMREFYFWRDHSGHEIDVLWQSHQGLELMEIKATETIKSDMFKGMDYLQSISSTPISSKTLVHSGTFNQSRSNGEVLSWRSIA